MVESTSADSEEGRRPGEPGAPPPRLSRADAAAKRAFDLVIATAVLVLASPVLFVVALAVRLTSRGPILFRLLAVGRDGRRFEMLKFRSMLVDAEARTAELLERNRGSGPMLKLRDDPRVTRVGRFLRRTSLDELPQLLNVLGGEMSLVGPRPISAQLYRPEHETGWHAWRLRALPGITGPWQVSGRSQDFDACCRLDIEYQRRWSLGRDAWMLLRTVPALLRGRGAS